MKTLSSKKCKFQSVKKNIKMLLLLLFYLFGLFYSLIDSNKAYAQSLSLSISPPLLEVMIKPGKSITQTYKISNLGEDAIITIHLAELDENIQVKNNPDFQKDKWVNIINKDISFDKPFLLEAGKDKQIILQINPPEDAKEQDYYRVLLFSTTPNQPKETSQSSVSESLGSILIINITSTGLPPMGAQIAQFTLPKIIDSFGPLETVVKIKNIGKTYFRPIGNIFLTGFLGQASYKINPLVILSGQTRTLSTEIPLEKSASLNTVSPATLKLSGFFLGKYNLEINFSLNESVIKIQASKTFYAIPWKLGLLFILLLMVFLWKRRKKEISVQK